MLTDTHAHLYDSAFDEDREQVIQRAAAAGVARILLPAIDSQSHERLFAAARQYPEQCRVLIGFHPTSVNNNPDFRQELQQVAGYLENPPSGVVFCGVGEVGLDLYWEKAFLAQQIEALEFQIDLALQYDLPLVIHTRDAWPEMIEVLSRYRERNIRGVIHSFSGTVDTYRAIKQIGEFVFGVGGVVTFKKSALYTVVEQMELSDLVLETDAPYLTPVPYRGKRNESSYIPYICATVAQAKGVSTETVEQVTTEAARRIFGNHVI